MAKGKDLCRCNKGGKIVDFKIIKEEIIWGGSDLLRWEPFKRVRDSTYKVVALLGTSGCREHPRVVEMAEHM